MTVQMTQLFFKDESVNFATKIFRELRLYRERFSDSILFSSDKKRILNFVTIEVQNIGRYSRFAQSLGRVLEFANLCRQMKITAEKEELVTTISI
jgi:hypothetical protein